jgi:hypothetical protein
MSSGAEWDVRKEAAWIVCNIATGGLASHLTFLTEHGGAGPIVELLDIGDVKLLLLAMEALEAILEKGGDYERSVVLIDEAGGTDRLELLQEHEDERVYRKAVSILEKYFNGEEEGGVQDSENTLPATSANQATFSFGMQSAPADGISKASSVFNFGSAAPMQFQFGAAAAGSNGL